MANFLRHSLGCVSMGGGRHLSTYDEDENGIHEEHTYVFVDDSKLEFDTLDGLSIATKNWTEQSFSTSKLARVRKYLLAT
jgi:inosine/xanthosine triphosphate pyrophosphatase family protein